MEFAFALLLMFGDAGDESTSLANELAIVRTESEGSEKNARFASHPLLDGYSAAGAPTASIAKLIPLSSSARLRFAFAGEFDGKLGDELVVVREKPIGKKKLAALWSEAKVGRLDLDVLVAPQGGSVKKAKIAASFGKDEIGFTIGDGRVTALAAIDHDGDGRDSLAVLRTFNDGRQQLTIHPVTMEKNQPLAPEVASNPDLGHVGAGEVLDIARVKSISGDDLLLLRRLDASGERIELRAAPKGVGEPPGKLFSSYDGLDAADGAIVERVATVALPNASFPFPDYAIVLQRKDLDGTRRLELAPLPLAVGSNLPALTSLALATNDPGQDGEIAVAFGIRRAEP